MSPILPNSLKTSDTTSIVRNNGSIADISDVISDVYWLTSIGVVVVVSVVCAINNAVSGVSEYLRILTAQTLPRPSNNPENI